MSRLLRMAISASFAFMAGLSAAQAGTFSGIHPMQSDRFVLGAGGYWTHISNKVSLRDKDSPGAGDIDFQDDLGMNDTDVQPAVVLAWRISNRSRLEVEYFQVGQESGTTIHKTIDWGDLEFEAGAKVSGNFDMDVGRLFFGYSFLKDDRKELGVGIGIHYLNLDTSLAGRALIDGEVAGKAERGFNDWAVLPNLGIYGNYALSSKWLISARGDWISANINDYDGTLWNAQAAIQYQLFEHFGVGLSYRYLALDLSRDSTKQKWNVDLDYSGPILFVTANF